MVRSCLAYTLSKEDRKLPTDKTNSLKFLPPFSSFRLKILPVLISVLCLVIKSQTTLACEKQRKKRVIIPVQLDSPTNSSMKVN